VQANQPHFELTSNKMLRTVPPPLGVPSRDQYLQNEMLSVDAVRRFRTEFRDAHPFPHILFKGLFSERLLSQVHDEFADLKSTDWVKYDTENEKKLGSRINARLGPATQLYFDIIHSGEFTRFLAAVSGLDYVIPDPMLFGGGLHEIPQGGKFAVHIDFNKHPVTALDNRLVFITYLNRDWLPSYGGSLELWDPVSNRKAAKIVPEFGHSILFSQTSKSLHGHPDAVCAPDGRPRRSVAAYFYTNGRDDEDSTSSHSTIVKVPLSLGPWRKTVQAVKYVTPPVLLDAGRAILKRLR